MPIVWPKQLEALNLVSFQINPHYTEATLSNHGGETRIDRLNEFLQMNQNARVIGLPEGMAIKRDGTRFALIGQGIAKEFKYGEPIVDLVAGDFSG